MPASAERSGEIAGDGRRPTDPCQGVDHQYVEPIVAFHHGGAISAANASSTRRSSSSVRYVSHQHAGQLERGRGALDETGEIRAGRAETRTLYYLYSVGIIVGA